MKTRENIRFRSFFLAFSMALLVFSLLYCLMAVSAHPATPQSLNMETVTAEASSYFPGREEALTVLFVGVSPDGREAGAFLLARFDPARGSVPIVTFPAETAVRNGDRIETLADAFRYGGAAFTRDALASALGVTIDRYVRMDEAAFLVAAETVGTVEFDLPCEVPVGEGAARITLAAGVQLLDGRKVADIIGHRGYEGGETARCAVISQLAAAIVNQRMDIALSTVVDKVFQKIINLVDTDISYDDYDTRKEAAAFLARLGKDPAVAVETSGEYSPDGALYTLSDTFTALLVQTMS